MATKIRLARHGKKGKPFYHIVTADSRAKRDGRYIERIGSYNPNTNPATIEIDFDRALYWVGVGAQPTDTVRAMLSYRGVLYKNHLLIGVKKGALTAEQAEEKFSKWLAEKESKIESKISSIIKRNEEFNLQSQCKKIEPSSASKSFIIINLSYIIERKESCPIPHVSLYASCSKTLGFFSYEPSPISIFMEKSAPTSNGGSM